MAGIKVILNLWELINVLSRFGRVRIGGLELIELVNDARIKSYIIFVEAA